MLCSHRHIGRLIDIGRHIARTDTEGGIARRIRGAHHRRSASRQDDIDAIRFHDLVDDRKGRLLDYLNDAVGGAGRFGRLGHKPRGIGAAFLGHGMGADDDGVAGEEREQRLVEQCGYGVGGRRKSENDPGRTRDFDNLPGGIDAIVGVIFVPVMLEKPDRAKPVLDLLVIWNTEPRFLDRPIGIVPGGGRRGLRCRLGNRQDFRARIGGEGACGPARLLHELLGVKRGQIGGFLKRLRGHGDPSSGDVTA